MQLYDTHAHFETEDDSSIAGILARARESGVTRLMAVGGSDELNRAAIMARNLRPDDVRLALGADRDQLSRSAGETLADIRRLLSANPCAAIGEIGLDFHYSPGTSRAQCDLFAGQLALADEADLPVVVHTREADDATLGVLDDVPWRHATLRGVIHCYTGDTPFARKLLDRGFMISISGIVTFRLAENVRTSARYVPDDRLLIETDSPFLAPVPLRGKRNEPAFIVHTAAFLAGLRGVTTEHLAELTSANALSIFG